MAATSADLSEAQANAYFADLEASHLAPLWRLQTQTREPRTSVQPHIWRWSEVYPRLQRAADAMRLAQVQGEGGSERRVLLLVNPGLKQFNASTNTLVASVQMILPGEIAPAHRHTPAAVRLMIQGHGAYTTVDGRQARMEPGDLILTPNWAWHDHGNESDEPVVWMDGLDRLLVAQLNAMFFDPYPSGKQEAIGAADSSSERLESTTLRPAWEDIPAAPRNSPRIVYKWSETVARLNHLADSGRTGPYGEIALSYVHPATGGHIMPTISCSAQLLRPGARSKARRNTGSAVYHVIAGRGASVVGGQRIAWEKGDFFAAPPWAWYEHINEGTDEAYLFCLNDRPVFQALALYREEAYAENEGHQPVTEAPVLSSTSR